MKISTILLILMLQLPVCVFAHTTVIFPLGNGHGGKTLKVVHFVPWKGDNIMGIRLHAQDSKNLKGLESISLVHEGTTKDISDLAVPDFYTVRDDAAGESYSIPLDRKIIPRAGDYIFVIKHNQHWKKEQGIYIRKISKFFINNGGFITDWPYRIFQNAPEIIPLSAPYGVYTGTLFRAQAVDDRGKVIPHAKILVEYLNYKTGVQGLDTSSPFLQQKEQGETVLFADNSGAFSFVPSIEGIWTFTLIDGDRNIMVADKQLQYNSSVSIKVNPLQ